MVDEKHQELITDRPCGRTLQKRRRPIISATTTTTTTTISILRSTLLSILFCCWNFSGYTLSLLNNNHYLPFHGGSLHGNIDSWSPSNRQIQSHRWTTTTTTTGGLYSARTDHDGHYAARPGVVHLPHINHVLCLSDLHTDHADNLAWLSDRTSSSSLSSYNLSTSDLIVVAGDISHEIDLLEISFRMLLRTGASILFVPGNHEAWLSSAELQESPSLSSSTSLAKLDRIYDLCTKLGVLTGCTVVGGTDTRPHPLWILPLASWYDGSLSIEGCEDLCEDFPKWPWVDFLRCRWGQDFPPSYRKGDILRKIPHGLTEYFLQQNEGHVIGPFQSAYGVAPERMKDHAGIMTVSHFLPNKQCLPDWKDVQKVQFDREVWLNHGGGGISAKFALVAGTELLDEHIRRTIHVRQDDAINQDVADQSDIITTDGDGVCGSSFVRHIHVFGHSHRPKDFILNSIRYIHNPLGKPRERDLQMVNPNVDFQLVWDTTRGEVDGDTVIRYWEEKGGGVVKLKERMNKSKRKSRYAKQWQEQ